MKASDFTELITDYYDLAATLDLRHGGKALIISDFHMGNGSRGDDLNRNGQLVMDVLEQYYLKDGWNLVLNGDIEDLQRYSYTSIREYWKDFYRIFDAFADQNRLYKNIGNHDEDLFFLRHYPYPLKEALRIETKVIPVFVYHGHQASRVYTKYNNLVRTALRYFFKPLGIRNISSARRPRKRFHAEKRAYEFSRKNGLVSIIGHTHRPLFESLGRFD